MEKASQGENYSDYFPPKHLLQTETQNRQSPQARELRGSAFFRCMQPPPRDTSGRFHKRAEDGGLAREATQPLHGAFTRRPATPGPAEPRHEGASRAREHCTIPCKLPLRGGAGDPHPPPTPLSPGHLLSISSPTTDVAAIQAFQAATKASPGAQRRGAEERLGLKQEPPAGGLRPPSPCSQDTPVCHSPLPCTKILHHPSREVPEDTAPTPREVPPAQRGHRGQGGGCGARGRVRAGKRQLGGSTKRPR